MKANSDEAPLTKGGTILTEDTIARLADEAEAGYNLDRATG